MKAKEAESKIFKDNWRFKNAKGSHRHYIHPTKPGKVTIPFHSGDLDPRTVKSIMKQAGLD
ncbi:MAG: type II toxin-antitoxin system HicA family toxin [Oscillospiraceae bacterium]|nr:type II toxin-antitoxin system HicA family toxin [Oscillospiraceae bacterium]